MVESDIVECVIGLGKNLFYNSVMESCIVICNKNKPNERKGKILFINGLNEVIEEKQTSYLSEKNIQNLFNLYKKYENIPKYSYVATMEEIKKNDYNLNVPLYVEKYDLESVKESVSDILFNLNKSSEKLSKSFEECNKIISEIIK